MKLNPKETALLVIDVQVDFCSPDGLSAQRGRGIEQITKILPALNIFHQRMRHLCVLTIFTQMITTKNTPGNLALLRKEKGLSDICLVDTPGAELYSVVVDKNDIVLTKERYDSFAETNLKKILTDKNIKNILIAGVRTDICVDATSKRAVAEGYNVFILEDLVGTSDTSKSQHDTILEIFGKYSGFVISSKKAEEMLI